MSHVYFYAEALKNAQARGIAATFIETRTAQERGSSYTSASIEALINGDDFPTLLAIVTRVNGCDYYARQIASADLERLQIGFNGRFAFRCHKHIKKADHVQLLKHTRLITADEYINGAQNV